MNTRKCPPTNTPVIAAVDIPDQAIFDFDGLRVAVFKDASVFVNVKDIAARLGGYTFKDTRTHDDGTPYIKYDWRRIEEQLREVGAIPPTIIISREARKEGYYIRADFVLHFVESAIDKARSRFNRLVRQTFLDDTLIPLVNKCQSLARDINKNNIRSVSNGIQKERNGRASHDRRDSGAQNQNFLLDHNR